EERYWRRGVHCIVKKLHHLLRNRAAVLPGALFDSAIETIGKVLDVQRSHRRPPEWRKRYLVEVNSAMQTPSLLQRRRAPLRWGRDPHARSERHLLKGRVPLARGEGTSSKAPGF